MTNKTRILVTCPKEVPPLLATEIEAMKLPILSRETAGVMTEGTFEDCMRLNLHVRTGHRVHRLIRDFKAFDANELYQGIIDIPWEQHIREDGYISIASSVHNDTIRDGRYANLKCKDAICDRMRKTCGRRPDSGSELRGAVIFLHWHGTRCGVYFDTSGEPLSRRGYRRIPMSAPMQETLAAAVVLNTGWKGDGCFINPMCGAGTLAIEAALIALNRAPGLLRREFAFMHLKDFKNERWEKLRADAGKAARDSIPGRIIATDINPQAVAAAKKNAAAAGVEHVIEFAICDFGETVVPEGGGVVVFNPEYGERMGETQTLIPVYRRIGDFLKRQCRGYRGYVFTGNRKLFNKVSLKPSRQWTLYNSNIECRLLEYEVFGKQSGSGLDLPAGRRGPLLQ